MFNDIILTTFLISWSFERIYYYFYHKKDNNSILNLNTPLSNPSQARYYEINSLNNLSNNSCNNSNNNDNVNDNANDNESKNKNTTLL